MKFLKLFLITLLLGGCSFKGLVISNLDWYIVNRMDKQLHLYSKQEDELKREVQKYLKAQVGKVVEIGSHFKNLETANFQIKRENEFFRKSFGYFEKSFRPILIKMLISLDQTQRERFIKSFEEKTKEYGKELSERETKNYANRFKYFFGELSEEQKLVITKNLSELKSDSTEWLKQREVLLADLKKVLLQKSEALSLERELDQIYERYFQRRYQSSKGKIMLKVIPAIMATLKPEQKARFIDLKKEVDEWVSIYSDTYSLK